MHEAATHGCDKHLVLSRLSTERHICACLLGVPEKSWLIQVMPWRLALSWGWDTPRLATYAPLLVSQADSAPSLGSER